MQIAATTGGVGAEITDVDVNTLTDAEFERIREAFCEHGLIFIRDQDLTPDAHVAFAERWAPINVNRFFTPVADHPQIAEVRKEPEDVLNIGGNWHTDHSYDQLPAMGSILYALEVPSSGGDTLFASMYSAYDALSDGLKAMLEGLNAVHSSRHVFGKAALGSRAAPGRFHNADLATQDAVHPVVITHPLSGRKSLYVNPGFTVSFEGWTADESRPLLDYLYRLAARPEHTHRFHWEKGSIAFWDNRATWHYALNDYPGERRLMHRITLEGGALQGAA